MVVRSEEQSVQEPEAYLKQSCEVDKSFRMCDSLTEEGKFLYILSFTFSPIYCFLVTLLEIALGKKTGKLTKATLSSPSPYMLRMMEESLREVQGSHQNSFLAQRKPSPDVASYKPLHTKFDLTKLAHPAHRAMFNSYFQVIGKKGHSIAAKCKFCPSMNIFNANIVTDFDTFKSHLKVYTHFSHLYYKHFLHLLFSCFQ